MHVFRCGTAAKNVPADETPAFGTTCHTMYILNLNSVVGVDARPYDVEMIRGEGGAGHINPADGGNMSKPPEAPERSTDTAAAPHSTAECRLNITVYQASLSRHDEPLTRNSKVFILAEPIITVQEAACGR